MLVNNPVNYLTEYILERIIWLNMKPRNIPPIPPNTFQAVVSPWLTAIHKKDLLVVMSYPSSDRQRRLLNLLDQPQTISSLLPNAKRYLFIPVDFRVDPLHTPEQLESALVGKIQNALHIKPIKQPIHFAEVLKTIQKQKHITIVLAAIGCEKLTRDKNTALLIWFTIQQRLGLLRQVLFFETNILDAYHAQLFGSVPAFQPRITTMCLYKKADVMQFIRYKEQEWKFLVSDAMKESIYMHCGGMLLLVKEALVYLRDNLRAAENTIWTHIEMQFTLASFWHGFGDYEKQTLSAIANNLPVTDFSLSSSIHYLLITGVIQQKGNAFDISIPLLKKYILQETVKNYSFTTLDGSILLNGTPIDAYFSHNEQAMIRCLIQAKGKIVPREKLADFLWPNNTGDYSDWALDSIISRIRKKLGTLGIPPETLSVQKKHGVQLKHNLYD